MGNPAEHTSVIHTPIHNVWKGTRGTETSCAEKRKLDSASSGERTRKSLNRNAFIPVTNIVDSPKLTERFWESRPEGESPVCESR